MLKLQALDLSKSYRGRKVVDDVVYPGRSRPARLRPRTPERRRNHGPAHVPPGPQRHQLPSPGTLGFSPIDQRRESARGAGNASADPGTAARPAGGAAGANGTRNRSNEQGVHALWWRAAPVGNRTVSHVATFFYSSRRTFFWNRPSNGQGSPGNHPGSCEIRNWRADYGS